MIDHIWEMSRKSDAALLGILHVTEYLDNFWWLCTFKATDEFESYRQKFIELEEALDACNWEDWDTIAIWMNDNFSLVGLADTPDCINFGLYIDGTEARLRGELKKA